MKELLKDSQKKQAESLPSFFEGEELLVDQGSDFEQRALAFSRSWQQQELDERVLPNHFYNCQLWTLEDKARDPQAEDSVIAAVKRKIDGVNQLRNNQIERIDQYLLEQLPKLNDKAPPFSETPGSIFDRLSICELKLYHLHRTGLQVADKSLAQELQHKYQTMQKQKEQLLAALSHLWDSVNSGSMRFSPFFQFKLYNDPRTNPYSMDRGVH